MISRRSLITYFPLCVSSAYLPKAFPEELEWDVIVVGSGMAGLCRVVCQGKWCRKSLDFRKRTFNRRTHPFFQRDNFSHD